MSNKNTQPSMDPADSNSLEGLMRHVVKKSQQNQDGMMPVKVIGYDRKTNRVHVQPLVQVQGTDGQIIDRAPIKSLPAFRFGGGGALMSFPIKAGDVGYVMAGDRDVSLVEQGNYEAQPPNTDRMHSFENGMFMPDSMQNGGIDDEDLDKIVIGNRDGSVKITFDGDTLNIISAAKVFIKAPETEIEGNVTIKGTLKAEGGVIGANGVTLERHVHKDVMPGTGLTGIPNQGK